MIAEGRPVLKEDMAWPFSGMWLCPCQELMCLRQAQKSGTREYAGGIEVRDRPFLFSSREIDLLCR
ncbi:MAG: hypothetical protein AVO38_01490 [delta proteobacterium ML8_D]|nr:MAG: hypothetical protein AVO38_01490 [delta proteobacterium ML8_D]